MSEALLIRPVAAIGRPSAWSERPSSVCCNRRDVTESGPAGGAQVFAGSRAAPAHDEASGRRVDYLLDLQGLSNGERTANPDAVQSKRSWTPPDGV